MEASTPNCYKIQLVQYVTLLSNFRVGCAIRLPIKEKVPSPTLPAHMDPTDKPTAWESYSDDTRKFFRDTFGFEAASISVKSVNGSEMGPLPLAPPARAHVPAQPAQPVQAEQPKPEPAAARPAEQYSLEPYATETYELVTWQGRRYTFTKAQRAVIKVLWEAWLKGRPEVEARTLLNASGTSAGNAKLSNLFTNKEATGWGTLIIKVGQGTCYRLAFYSPGDPDPEMDE